MEETARPEAAPPVACESASHFPRTRARRQPDPACPPPIQEQCSYREQTDLGRWYRALDGKTTRVRALFDRGAHVTVIRESCLPAGANVLRRAAPTHLRTAALGGGTVEVVGGTIVVVTIGERMIQTQALVSPNLAQEMLIGAETMQGWDITIRNGGGRTSVEVGKDFRDPDVQEID